MRVGMGLMNEPVSDYLVPAAAVSTPQTAVSGFEE